MASATECETREETAGLVGSLRIDYSAFEALHANPGGRTPAIERWWGCLATHECE